MSLRILNFLRSMKFIAVFTTLISITPSLALAAGNAEDDDICDMGFHSIINGKNAKCVELDDHYYVLNISDPFHQGTASGVCTLGKEVRPTGKKISQYIDEPGLKKFVKIPVYEYISSSGSSNLGVTKHDREVFRFDRTGWRAYVSPADLEAYTDGIWIKNYSSCAEGREDSEGWCHIIKIDLRSKCPNKNTEVKGEKFYKSGDEVVMTCPR